MRYIWLVRCRIAEYKRSGNYNHLYGKQAEHAFDFLVRFDQV